MCIPQARFVAEQASRAAGQAPPSPAVNAGPDEPVTALPGLTPPGVGAGDDQMDLLLLESQASVAG